MALANSLLSVQQETAKRSSLYGPKIKSETDELSALGGMTRLVARRSSSSPSVPGSSPPSQHSSPPISMAETQSPQTYFSPHDASASWQSYTHIQNFNVNINMNGDFYPNGLPVTPTGVQGNEMSMPYQMPEQGQMQHHQHHHPSQSMDMGVGQDAYYASMNGYGSGYLNGNGNGYLMPQMVSTPEVTTPPQDIHDSWQNFMAQYKQ